MLRVGRIRKRKESLRKTKTTQTRLPQFELALLGQLLASRAWNFTTQPRKQNTRYVRSLNITLPTITPPTVWKRNTSHTVSNVNKGKQKWRYSCKYLLRKKIKAEEVRPSKTAFLQWATLVMFSWSLTHRFLPVKSPFCGNVLTSYPIRR